MIKHRSFHRLRLSDFLPADSLTPREDWEFMDHIWVGQGVGFTEFLCLESAPDDVRSISLSLPDLGPIVAAQILGALDLKLREGMTLEEIVEVLGRLPDEVLTFVADRKSYEFEAVGQPEYDISATVLDDGGLTYLVVIDPTYRVQAAEH